MDLAIQGWAESLRSLADAPIMNQSNEENLGLDWLDKMLERLRSEPVFESPQWNAVLAELGRITV